MLLKADSSSSVLLLLLCLCSSLLLAALTLSDPPRTDQHCKVDQFACLSGKTQCIPLDWQCDGWAACDDQSDETGCHPIREERFRFGNGYDVEDVIGVPQPVRVNKKCPSGWHHYEKTASCYKAFLRKENYWQAVETCQRLNGSLATFVTDEELQFILKIDVEFDDKVCEQARDQCKFWVGYQYVITTQNHSLVGQWEVKAGLMQAFLPPDSLPSFSQESATKQDNVFCGQLQRFQSKSINERGLHSWHAENCYKRFPFICKRRQTCVDIKDNVVNEGYYFTPKGDDPCLSCTCHDGEPEMCVAALCERPQSCQHFRKDPKECCKFTCLDPDSSSLFDSMASGMRLIVSCISSFLILSLLLFMVHRLRQRRRERIETLIGGNLHHFNLGRRVPGYDCGPNAFGTGLTPLHLSDDGDGGAFHFQEPPPPYAAYKYPELPHPDDPPPPYEASVDPDSLLYMELARSNVPAVPRHHNTAARCLQVAIPQVPAPPAPPPTAPGPAPQRRDDSIDRSTLLVVPDMPNNNNDAGHGHAPDAGRHSHAPDAGRHGHAPDAGRHGHDAGRHGHAPDAGRHGHAGRHAPDAGRHGHAPDAGLPLDSDGGLSLSTVV